MGIRRLIGGTGDACISNNVETKESIKERLELNQSRHFSIPSERIKFTIITLKKKINKNHQTKQKQSWKSFHR